jgi:type III pantothenate kinase
MFLAINIGNTNVKLGVFSEEGGTAPIAAWRIATHSELTSDDIGLLLRSLLPMKGVALSSITAAAMCSVVPPLTPTFVNLCRAELKVEPLVVSANVETGIRILYDNPGDLGADRIADAVAGYRLYGAPVITVDLGTASVFNAVSRDGAFIGGAIAPGISIAANALLSKAAMLRRVELTSPPTAIGRNTVQAVQSGLVLGYAEMVKGMVSRLDQELGGGSRVIATGGLAGTVAKETMIFDAVNPDLALIGLKLIHEMNPR